MLFNSSLMGACWAHLSDRTRMLGVVEHGGFCAVDDAVEDMRSS